MRKIAAAALVLAATVQAHAITLEECYRMVRENYPLVKQYELTERMSGYSFENAARGYLPQISLAAQATIQSDVTAFPDSFNNLLALAGVDMAGLSHDQYKVQLNIVQTIWDGGYSKAQREAVKAQQEVSELTLDKDMDALKTQINQMYFGILLMESNLQTNLYMDTLMTSSLRTVEAAVRNGTAMQSDVDNVQVELLTLRQQRSQIESALLTYREMLGIMIGRRIGPEEEFEVPQVLLLDPERNLRTELMLFDARIREIDNQRRMLDVAVIPKFSFFAQGWYGKPGLNVFDDMVYNKMSWNGMAGITMQWDITGFYTRRNDLHKIELSQRSIELQRDAFLWNSELEQTRISREIDRMRDLKASDDEIVRLRRSVRMASESKFRNGVITVNDLLRDMMNENAAIVESSRHELEMLKNIYDLKIMLNQ